MRCTRPELYTKNGIVAIDNTHAALWWVDSKDIQIKKSCVFSLFK